VLQDLQDASALLPVALDIDERNHPCRPAAFAMLARVYLGMRDYTHAGMYADSCLRLYDTLVDYNSVNTTSFLPFGRLNMETLYQGKLLSASNVLKAAVAGCMVDTILYRSYATGDLRRDAFFAINTLGYPVIKGSYNGGIFPFGGVAIDEVYLIRAECLARMGETAIAMNWLNRLLQKRWKAGQYIPVTAASAGAALEIILAERRKELPFRGLRWSDLRRLNKEGATITLNRFVNGMHYQLQPNSPLYVLPIPPDVIALSGMQQNPR